MLILRVIGLLLVMAIAICIGIGLLTRQAHYFRWAWELFRYGVVVALVFMSVFALERLIAPVV